MFMLFINYTMQNADFYDIFTTDGFQLFMLLYADNAVVFAKSSQALQSILDRILSCTIEDGVKKLIHPNLN